MTAVTTTDREPQSPGTGCVLAIPAYNERDRITACLEAAAAARLPTGFFWREWVVLDDHSDDDTVAQVAAWSGRVGARPIRARVSAARSGKRHNLAELHAERLLTGDHDDVVVVVDADVQVDPDSFAHLLAPFAGALPPAVVWGADRPDDRSFGHWASGFQMDLVLAIARRVGPDAARSYGRFFAYRAGSLGRFSWGADGVDDVELMTWVRRQGLSVRSCWDATVAVTPAGSFRDFYLQTYRAYWAVGSGSRAPDATRAALLRAATALAVRHPARAGAYLAARVDSAVRHRRQHGRFSPTWEPSRTTKGALRSRRLS